MRVGMLIAICFLFLSACGSPTRYGPVQTANGPSSDISVLAADDLPAPTARDRSVQFRPYRIGPFDRLAIDVFGVEELTRKEYRTDAGGRVSFPLAGVIEAGGLTPAELENEIAERLRGRYIRNPQVTVNLVETVSQVVTVDGQVRQPGLYPVVGRMTLMQAVATAKGLEEFAKQDEVVVFRTVDGQRMAAIYNLKAIRSATYEDPEIYANDIIIVGESSQRRLIRDVIGLTPTLLSPLIILLTR